VVKISRILVAVDGSENADRAFEYAAYIAKQCEVERLFIINVIEGYGRNINAWAKHDSFVKDLEHNSKELLEKYKSKAYSQAFTTVEITGTAGNAGEEILRAAEREKIDTIVMGSRGRSTASELLLGSVSHNVLHNARCPVFIVR
jgi:nucleotide-binding universal stress UspA family protein